VRRFALYQKDENRGGQSGALYCHLLKDLNRKRASLRSPQAMLYSYTLEGHLSYINAVAISPDGKLVASASDDKDGQALGLGDGSGVSHTQGRLECRHCLWHSRRTAS
jgi:WD40 repeat protein